MSLKAIGNLSTLLKDFGKSRNGLEQIGEALQSVGTESIITAASVNKLTQAELEHILAGQGMTAEEIQAALATSSFATAEGTATVATNAFTASIGAAAKGLWTFLTTNPVGWAILATTAIFGLVKAYDALTESFDEALEKAGESQQAYEEQKSKVNSLNSELETTSQRLEELTSKESLTIVEQEELENLRSTNELLKEQLEIEQAIENMKLQTARNDAINVLSKKDFTVFDDPSQNGKTAFEQRLSTSAAAGQYAPKSHSADVIEYAIARQEHLNSITEERNDIIKKQNDLLDENGKPTDEKAFNEYSNKVKSLNDDIKTLSDEVIEYWATISEQEKYLFDANGNAIEGQEERIEQIARLRDLLVEYSTGVSQSTKNKQSKIDSFLDKPTLKEDVAAAKAAAKELDGISFEQLEKQFPELATAIETLASQTDVSVDDVINTINSLASEVNTQGIEKEINNMKSEIAKSFSNSQDWISTPIFNEWLNGLSDEQIQILYEIVANNDTSSWSFDDFKLAMENAQIQAEETGEIISNSLIQGYEAIETSVSNVAASQEALNRVFLNGDSVTQDVYDSLVALIGSEEEVGACIDSNNGYVVTNADSLRDMASAANEAVKSNLQMAESQQMLKYHELVTTLRSVCDGLEEYDDSTMAVVDTLLKEIDATQLQIAQYKLLEQQLLGTTSAFDKLANAQALDSARDYTDELSDSISGLISAFENHEFGTEYFQTAFDALIPENIYQQFTDAGDQLDAGWDYLNTKLARYFTFDNNSVSIDFDNIRAFVEDGLNTAFGDSTVFLGDLENFDLNPQITTLEQFADALGITETAAFSLGNAISKYTTDDNDFLSKLAMDGAELETQMMACDQQMANLLQKQTELGRAGQVGSEEWQQLQQDIANCDQQMGQLQQKARQNISATIEIEADIADKQAEVDDLKEKLDSLDESDIEYTAALKNYEKADNELNQLLQRKYELDEPVELTVEVALEQVQNEINQTRAELEQIADYDGHSYSLKAECSTNADEFNELMARLNALETEQQKIEIFAGIENKADLDKELNSIQKFKINDKEFSVKANTLAARNNLNGIISLLNSVRDKTATVTVYNRTINSTTTSRASRVTGTANYSGTAHEHGVWGTKTAEKDSLVGELGEEIVVDPRTGVWETVGENGAEMVDLPKGAIVFNHRQTEELLKNRRINSRGKAYAKGNAYFAGFSGGGNYTFGTLSGNSNVSSTVSNTVSATVPVTVKPTVDNKSLEEQLEETLKKMKETIDDVIGNFEHEIFIKQKNGASTEQIVSIYKSMQKYVHEQADAYRKLGLDENSDYIQDLQKQWWEYQESIVEARVSASEKIIKEHENAITLNENWLEKAIDRNDRTGVAKYTSNIISEYKAAQEELHKQAEYYRSLGYSDTSDEVSALSDKWWEYYDKIKEVAADAWQQILDNAHEAVDEILNLYDTLKTAAKEYEASGFITVSTFQELAKLGVENLAYLKDENDLLVINKENIEKVIAARTQQMAVETALNYVQQIRSALAENNITELSRLTLATQCASNSTWDLVYAQVQLAKSEGLSDDMYLGAISNINNLRALSDITISGIGKIENGLDEARKKANETVTEQSDALKDILKYVEEMIKQEIKDQIEGINDQIDRMKDLVDLQKKSLDLEKEKDSYARSVAEKTKEMAKIQQQLALLELDDSRDSIAKQQQLREKLAELSNDLADDQSDHATDATKDALDEMYNAYKTEKEKEIEKLEDSISSEEKLYQLAIERITTQWDTLYQQLIAWNTQYGTVTNQEITEAWNLASAAVQEYGGYLNAVLETQKKIAEYKASNSSTSTSSGGTSSSTGTPVPDDSPTVVGKPGNYDTSGGAEMEAVHNIIKRMYANSRAWEAADKEERKRLDAENLKLGTQDLARYIPGVYRKGGTWYTANGKLLYEVYKDYIYHDGGIAGNDPTLKQDEMFSKIKKGELILNKRQQEGLYKILDEQDTMLSKYGKLLGSVSGNDLMAQKIDSQFKRDIQQTQNSITNGNSAVYNNLTIPVQVLQKLDDAEIRQLTKKVSEYTINELDETFTLRGKRSFRR